MTTVSAVDSGGAGGAPEIGGFRKGESLISAYQSLAITTNTPGFKQLFTALSRLRSINIGYIKLVRLLPKSDQD